MSRRVPRGVETRSPAERGYDKRHRTLRELWAPLVAGGAVNCARGRDCLWRHRPTGTLILPGEPWDLGHDDNDRSQYSGPEHRRCNRATAGRRKKPRASRKW